METINPKVHAGAGGGFAGLTVGKAIAIIVIAKGFETETELVKLAIEFLIEGIVSVAGVYFAGYFKAGPS